jgi:rfaE bifunctional protein nucleotidyltransferase chain/domain
MALSKILTQAEMVVEAGRLRAEGRLLVFTNGCFDLLHVGHVRYLQAARRLGSALLVALNGDASVRALKGPSRPVNVQADRAEVLAALECVDYVTIFDEPRVSEVIRGVRPGLYVKGGDYTVDSLDPGERAALEAVGARIEILGLVPGKSTTGLLERMGADSKVPVAETGVGK